MESPKTAHTTQNSSMATPTMNVGLRSSSRQRAVAAAGTVTGVTGAWATVMPMLPRWWRPPLARPGGGRAALRSPRPAAAG